MSLCHNKRTNKAWRVRWFQLLLIYSLTISHIQQVALLNARKRKIEWKNMKKTWAIHDREVNNQKKTERKEMNWFFHTSFSFISFRVHSARESKIMYELCVESSISWVTARMNLTAQEETAQHQRVVKHNSRMNGGWITTYELSLSLIFLPCHDKYWLKS